MEPVGLLEVTRVRALTPRMRRVSFRAPVGFATWPDQQLKLCFPRDGQDVPLLPPSSGDEMRWYQRFLAIPEAERPWLRGFTVRAFDPARSAVDIDFVLHGDTGPATRWALTAAPGQVLGRYGPSEVYRRPLGTGDRYLFAGDETALPAIGTLLESLPATVSAHCYVEVAGAEEEQPLPSRADVEVHWVHRDRGGALLDAVRAATVRPTELGWLAGEAGTVRALRRHLVGLGLPRRAVEFAGYWRRALTQDDAPTAEDLAEAQERLAGF